MITTNTLTSISSLSNKNSFTLGSHQSFPLRYGWIEKFCFSLIKKHREKNEDFQFFDKVELRPEELSQAHGLGNNMCKSLRFWLKICGIIHDNPNSRQNPYFTKFALNYFGPNGCDAYLNNINTIWWLHYNLISNYKSETTWSWFFNEFRIQSFDRQQLSKAISEDHRIDKKYSEENIKRDIDCFVRSYVGSNPKQVYSAEDALECPFTELNLIRKGYGNTLVAKRQKRENLPYSLFLESIRQLKKRKFDNVNTITVETLLNNPFSPGCNFLLSRDGLLEKLEIINEKTEGAITLDQSSGLAQILVNDEILLEEKIEELEAYERNKSTVF